MTRLKKVKFIWLTVKDRKVVAAHLGTDRICLELATSQHYCPGCLQ